MRLGSELLPRILKEQNTSESCQERVHSWHPLELAGALNSHGHKKKELSELCGTEIIASALLGNKPILGKIFETAIIAF